MNRGLKAACRDGFLPCKMTPDDPYLILSGGLMIIWGTYVTKKIIRTGTFYCPGCKQHRGYNLRRPKKWGHLYWIPIIPMEELDRYVECTTCGKAWTEASLQYDPIRQEGERNEKLSAMVAQVMGLMAGPGGQTMRLADTVGAATRDLLAVEMKPEAISAAFTAAHDAAAVLTNAAQQAPYLTDRGKDLLLRAAISAAPSHPLGDRERALAAEIGQRLGMMPAHVNGVLAEISSA
jgi:hypothetical protein